ncbi:Uma2 family endonuclease [Synechococcales cyanobacterium C]|uniref:Uma2 family endonuclease n=1 Tax=Petrachloros mirabilis ULC683 TaxID=2781853 RepID=A0A8K2A9U3_9CYAN|nr:Uma2 family endonuclease [Petrachloros mirabilis]NCJ08420.1 Uma2 family endonuclease [Petrachloros mirabilis ULC683]
MIALNLRPTLQITDSVFEQLCQSNPNLRLERTTQGELVIMPPAGSESGRQNLSLSAQLWYWNQQSKLGVAFDSSAGFTLANDAIRAPDAAWIEQSRWESLSREQRSKFAPICPDFVIELKSPSDDLALLESKLQEYIDNGSQLGWLINAETQQVYCYRPGQPVQICDRPTHLSGEPLLANFLMDFTLVWS